MAHRLRLRARHQQQFAYSGRAILRAASEGTLDGGADEGFFFEDTRFLSLLALSTQWGKPEPLGSSPVEGDRLLAYFQVPEAGDDLGCSVYIEVAYRVTESLEATIRVQNYAVDKAIPVELSVAIAADFADATEVSKGEREQSAPMETCWHEAEQLLRFTYQHPQLKRATEVQVRQGAPRAVFDDGRLCFAMLLVPHVAQEITLTVVPVSDGQRRSPEEPAAARRQKAIAAAQEEIREGTPHLISTNGSVARAWKTATADLPSLPLGMEGGAAAPSAGIPMYQHFFGRDTLTAGWQAAMAGTAMLRDALRVNAAWQGTKIDDWSDEEPGKMIHEIRWGPLSVLGHDALAHNYGDYATPPDFLVMLGQYLAWTNDRETTRALLPAAREAVQWLERYADIDGDGFIEYLTRSPQGIKNQGWKDARDSVIDAEGRIVENPIASSELQAYWYAGLQQAGVAFMALGEVGYGVELWRKAAALQRRFNERFWMEDEGCYAFGLGPGKEQIRSIGSNDGHLLAAGIVPRDRAPRVVRRLMAPDMFSGWGIRTLSSEHVAYNPFSYHRGSVWAVESGTIALGFARYGEWHALHRLAKAVFDASDLFIENRIPEVIGGIQRDADHPHPGIYPGANEPQAWSASMVVTVVQALLGLNPCAELGVIFVDPHLPRWLPDLRLRGVRVAGTVFDFDLRLRADGRADFRARRRAGRIRVIPQAPPQAPVPLARRLRAAASSLSRLN
ncbi:MAG: glycogen debranching N-terminal domain-containing protein [Chloroflexota bacterium]